MLSWDKFLVEGVKWGENAIRFGLRIDDMTFGDVFLVIREGTYGMRVGRVGMVRGVIQ